MFLLSGFATVSSGAASAGRYVVNKVRNISEKVLNETHYGVESDGLLLDEHIFEDSKRYQLDTDAVETRVKGLHYGSNTVDDHIDLPIPPALFYSATANTHGDGLIHVQKRNDKAFGDSIGIAVPSDPDSEPERTHVKEITRIQTPTTSPSMVHFSQIQPPNFDSVLSNKEETSVISGSTNTSVLNQSRNGKAPMQGTRTGGNKSLKTKYKKKSKSKAVKRKRDFEDTSASSDDNENEHVRLMNIQKDEPWRSSTSDYMSQVSADSQPTQFQRNNGTRMSSMFKWNSVIGFSEPGVQDTRQHSPPAEPGVQDTRQNSPSAVIFKNVTNAIFSAGSGDVKESSVMSFNSTEWDKISDKVKDQTKKTLDNFKQQCPFVETEGYMAAKLMLIDSRKKNKLVFVLGYGDGSTTVVNQLLAEMSSSDWQKTEENDDSSQSDSDETGVVPYVIYDPMDWYAIDNDKPAVIAVHDPAGAIQTDMTRLNETLSRIQSCQMSRSDVTIIVSMRKLPDFDERALRVHFDDHIVDLQSKHHIVERDTMTNLFESLMGRNDVHYSPDERSETKKGSSDHERRYISRQTVHAIVTIADKRGFVKSIGNFFEDHFSEGIKFFCKPDTEIIRQIIQLCKENNPGFFALLAVHDYGGELSSVRVEQIRRALKTNKPMSALDLFSDNDARVYNYKPFIPKQSLAMKHAKDTKKLKNLGDMLLEGMELLEGLLLEETNNIYRFQNGKVGSSLHIVLAKLYPDAFLSSCTFDFISDYVSPRSVGEGRNAEMYVAVESSKHCEVKKAMIKRITVEMLQRNLSKCTSHPVFKESWFVDDLLSYWKRTDQAWRILQQQESALDPYCLLYFGQYHQFRLPSNDKANNLAEKIRLQTIWDKKRRSTSKRTEWVINQEHEAILHAIELGLVTTVRLLAEKGTSVTPEMLQLAIEHGQLDIVRVLIEEGFFTEEERWHALMNAFDTLTKEDAPGLAMDVFELLVEKTIVKQPLIHYAVSTNNRVMAEILCNMSMKGNRSHVPWLNLNVISSNGDTALNIATRNENEQIVQMLLEACAKQINQGNVEKLPIHEAAVIGNVKLLELLIEDNPKVMNIKDPDGNTPLHLVSQNGHRAAVCWLLEQSAIEKDIRNGKKQTALHLAVLANNGDIVQHLIHKGANMLLTDAREETALSLAGNHSNYNVADIILKAQCTKGFCHDSVILMKAVLRNDIRMLKLLISHGYSMNTVDQRYGSPIFASIKTNRHELVEFLLTNGTDVNQSYGGLRPIMWAALKGDKQMFSILRRHGADITITEESTMDSIVHNAVKENNEDLTKEILSDPESFKLVDMKNIDGETAVHTACRVGKNPNILQCLVDAKFSVSCRNRQAERPMQILELRKAKAFKKDYDEYIQCIQHLMILRGIKGSV